MSKETRAYESIVGSAVVVRDFVQPKSMELRFERGGAAIEKGLGALRGISAAECPRELLDDALRRTSKSGDSKPENRG